MGEPLVCWNCGAPLHDEPLPLARLATCRSCEAELHVCRMCRHYAPRLAERCAEERAEPPADKARANFCDYYSPAAQAYRPNNAGAEQDAARAELAALFGEPAPRPEAPAEPAVDEAEKARRELERLFRP